MAIFKCKMCGGQLDIAEKSSICTCEYCGTEQTIPRLDTDRKSNLYDRANHFRRNNDYDKAMGIYEQILNEDNTDAEAYWSLVLCRYGIEYVEDPSTHKHIPTINRAQFTSIYADEDYKAALEHADILQKGVYEREAKTIDDIQKGILAISNQEEPFDVFICYKESDETGRRTRDSVLANDLYHQLTQEGFKVFYAKITLEDKLGQEYEPYIFAALNSAKAMVVLGTKPEYFNAVWVKNEWSRYLALIKKGEKKTLIPAYRDMDPYDLPEEFSHLQAQDMSKLGFMQDLIRGIKKIIGSQTEKVKVVQVEQPVIQQNSNITVFLKRGNIALEDQEWAVATGFFEEALNLDAECAEGYLGKFLAQKRCQNFEAYIAIQKNLYATGEGEKLEACPEDWEHINQMVKEHVIEDYLDEKTIKAEYLFDRTYISELNCRRNQKDKQHQELQAEKLLSRARQYASGNTKELIDDGLSEIWAVLDERVSKAVEDDKQSQLRVRKAYQDYLTEADDKVQNLYDNAQRKRENDYQLLLKRMDQATKPQEYDALYTDLVAMKGYKDSKKLAEQCKEKSRLIKNQQEKKRKIIIAIVSAATFIIAAVSITLYMVLSYIPSSKYNAAMAMQEQGRYEEALQVYEALSVLGYNEEVASNSKMKIEECKTMIIYRDAIALKDAKQYEEAIAKFKTIPSYNDTQYQIGLCETAIKDISYDAAMALMQAGKYDEAQKAFEAIKGYRDSAQKIKECEEKIVAVEKETSYFTAIELEKNGDYVHAKELFDNLHGYLDSYKHLQECDYRIAIELEKNGDYAQARELYDGILGYLDSYDHLRECDYQIAIKLEKNGDYVQAQEIFGNLNNYLDSSEHFNECGYQNAMILVKEGKIKEAIKAYDKVENYKDSQNQKILCEKQVLKNPAVGDFVAFGNYNDNTEWIVLERNGSKVLLLSRYAIEKRVYHTSYSSITWEKCTLRNWLNSTYINAAFNDVEKKAIISTTISNPNNSTYGTAGGNNTNDKVFLLSIDEVKKYFKSYSDRKTTLKDGSSCWWWLRSPGYNVFHAANVNSDGSVYASGSNRVNFGDGAVRPTLWVDISNLKS